MKANYILATCIVSALTLGPLACASTASEVNPDAKNVANKSTIEDQYSLHMTTNANNISAPDCLLTQTTKKATMRCKSGELELGPTDPEHMKLRELISKIDWVKEAKAAQKSYSVGDLNYTLTLVDGWVTYKVTLAEPHFSPPIKELIAHIRSYDDKLQKTAQGPCLKDQKYVGCSAPPPLSDEEEDPLAPRLTPTVCGPPLCAPGQTTGQACSADIHCASSRCKDDICVEP